MVRRQPEFLTQEFSKQSFNVRNMEARLADVGELWGAMTPYSLDDAIQHLNAEGMA
jgi:hypothetical protein